jgi:hypothetical protein
MVRSTRPTKSAQGGEHPRGAAPGHLALAAAKCRHMTTIHHLAQRGSLKVCPAPGTGHAAGRDMDRMTQPGLI